jgi:hypothetical protein
LGSAGPSSGPRDGSERIGGSGSGGNEDDGGAIVTDESSFLRLEAAAKAEEEDEATNLESNGEYEGELNLDELLKGIGNLSGDYGSDEDNS